MRFFFWASYTFGLLWMWIFFLQGGKYVRRSLGSPPPGNPEEDANLHWPPAVILVPATGRDPHMRACLSSLLTQDYPDYEVIFITADLSDPATEIVREVLRALPRGRHVVSGRAAGCSQKNHNLVAGLKILKAPSEILVFCDANHLAPRHFLKELVRPLVTGEALMTTGFHRIIPRDGRLATLGMLVTVLIIHLCHGHAGLVQPWGGATAIWRSVVEHYRIARLWAEVFSDHCQTIALHARPIGRHTVLTQAIPHQNLLDAEDALVG